MPTAVTRSALDADALLAEQLEHVWETEPGLLGWLGSVDHKQIGRRYLVTAMVFLIIGGLEAGLMRWQLALANQHVLSPGAYDRVFTLHGATMIFWYAAPILSGFGNYLVPMLLGTRDMAYPRLNAFSYWSYLFSGVLLYVGVPLGEMPAAGWFAYAPLTERLFSPGLGIDFYAIALLLLTVSTTAGAINFIATIARHRAPGMTLSRTPLLMYSTFTVSTSVLFSLPALTAALLMLELDRRFDFHFFTSDAGGDPLLWQQLFWFFGHPWVYVVFLPATGMVSMLLPVFARRPIVGYPFVALATVLTGVVGFGVWVHHMFAVGLSHLSMSFFSAASMTISMLSTVQVFAWIATLWKGRPVITTSLLFALGFIASLIIGGLSGVITALVPVDWQVHDTYFVVAHLHYVLVGANVFPVFAAFYYWLPKIIGRRLGERLGRWSFWLMFVGFNAVFFPMHVAGALGMPRRIYTYAAERGWEGLNLFASLGVIVLTAGILVSIVNLLVSARSGQPAGRNPWNADTLEWANTSPPPSYAFVHLPTVTSRHPLWEPERSNAELREEPVLDRGRFTPTTSFVDARPLALARMPRDTVTPLLTAAGLLALGAGAVFFKPLWAAAGAVGAIAAAAAWLWPEHGPLPELPAGTQIDVRRGTLGIWLFIATEATLFALLFLVYAYLSPYPATKAPALSSPLMMLAVLLGSSVVLHLGGLGQRRGRVALGRVLTGVAAAMGVAFLVMQGHEYAQKLHELTPQMGAYGSIFYTLTGLHGAHVGLGVLMLCFAAVAPRRADRPPHATLHNASVYWHFVDAVWVVIVAVLYVGPHLGAA